ncbi:hypothetical protein [Streptomyces sp. NRRL F-4489]|uniref:hypothetical protein n=1 Tax=Streptomyces sp. NRRL F-4489 TaxID=1609095 RepID=UPI000AA0FBE3|nr:hypothetical protein [Streptomyces sp. NRRL F-4489]
MGAGPGDGAAEARLRAVLRAADEEIGTPAGLWERVREPAPAPVGRPSAPVWRSPYAVALGVAAGVAVVVLGVWWLLLRPGAADVRPAGPPPSVPVTVYNSEAACRTGRTLECALRLARDPYGAYAARGNAAGRVWHGDVLAARCVVTDGQLVRDEQGVTSTRWYRVRTGQGVEGWLPGVRTRNTREVPVCPEAGRGR